MNDFNRKNIALSFSKLMTIPYRYKHNVQFPQQYIEDYHELFDGDVNNAYTQLVENDLYIENRLNYMSSYTEGVKSNDYDSIRLGENGYKFMQDDDGILNFYRKVETDLSMSLQQQTVLDGVNYITAFGSKIYCGTAGGIASYSYTESGNNFEYVITGESRCCSKFNGDLIFGLEHKIAVITSNVDQWEYYDVFAEDELYTPQSIRYLQQWRAAVIVADDGRTLLSARIDSGFEAKVIRPDISESILINDVLFSDADDPELILLTTDGLYKSTDTIYKSYIPIFENELKGLNVFKHKSFDGIGTVLFTDIGLYCYSESDGIVYKMSGDSTVVNDVIKYYSDRGKTWYLGVFDDEIRISYNIRRWQYFLSISAASGVKLGQIYAIDKKDIVIGSSGGVFVFKGSYYTVIDSIRFTEENIYQLYAAYNDYIENQMQSEIDKHIAASHQPGSTYQSINDDYMDSDMELLEEFTTPQKAPDQELLSASYDYVYKIVTGTASDEDDIQVMIKNFATGGNYVVIPATYVIKLWKSGFNEFNIYIPTTKTYYLNHIAGTPKCEIEPGDIIDRKNLKSLNLADSSISTGQTSEMSSHYTDIVINILSTQYEIENVLNMTIRGNSLPLGIYKDQSYAEMHGGAAGLFQSFIEPSMMFSNYDISSTDGYEMYTFRGCCFGTDAQAVQLLTTTKTTHYYDGNMLSVTFHGNGRYTSTHRSSYVQKLRRGENNELTAWPIAGNRFVGNSSSDYFYGWTFKQDPADNDINVDVKKTSDIIYLSEFKNKSNLHMYAVWFNVDWKLSHTELDIYQAES